MSFPSPRNETARLAALRDLQILDTPAERLYDDVVQLAAAICRTPIALINLVDADRQWGKALVGLESSEAPREASFCARTIVADDGLLVVPNTLEDPAWATNAQVVGEPRLRFYAGAAIVDGDGHALGSVCVADREPRVLAAQALDALQVLARQTAAHFALRRQTRRLHEANDELRRLAVQDPLTGLPNRTLLYDRLEHALRRSGRSGGVVGVIFCDLDGFKAVNDELGHEAGDELLCTVAQRLLFAARETDTVARLAGDEFVVVCPDVGDETTLTAVAERLSAAVARPTRLRDGAADPGMSMGLVLAAAGEDVDSVLRRADAAMYAAKRGRLVAV